jgi:hypothetical protein
MGVFVRVYYGKYIEYFNFMYCLLVEGRGFWCGRANSMVVSFFMALDGNGALTTE